MVILCIGGTGNLSLALTQVLLSQGHTVVHLNRGKKAHGPNLGVETIQGDIQDTVHIETLVQNRYFDVVIDFICFTPESAQERIKVFHGRTSQYVFISSASIYEKPARGQRITEDCPRSNPFWPYSQKKIAAEDVFMDAWKTKGFPLTIVRPSHTYGTGWLPSPFSSADFTVSSRILRGAEVISPGDGQSLWTLTHARDFAQGLQGLLGLTQTLGEAYHITSDEFYTWDEVYKILGRVLGREPRILHIPSEFIARIDPELGQTLLGDKSNSSIFNCEKLRRIVPTFNPKTSLQEGMTESWLWRQADPSRMTVDGVMDQRLDAIIAPWHRAMGSLD